MPCSRATKREVISCMVLRAHSKITARFEGQLYHYLWPLLNHQILTVAHYSSGLAQSSAAKSNATLTLKTAHLFLSEPLLSGLMARQPSVSGLPA